MQVVCKVFMYIDIWMCTHTCIHLLQSKYIHTGIYAHMKNVKYQKKKVYFKF